jgi:hypothetical protein
MDTLRDQLATDLRNHDTAAVAADRKAIRAERALLEHAELDLANDRREMRALWRDLGEDLREIERLEDQGDGF